MTKPNFFIVGAAKCGTTSLYYYLRSHPNVYFGRFKEPNFFAKDLIPPKGRPKSLEDYLSFYADAKENHLLIGDSSPWNLYSSVAIQDIYAFNKDARIIALIRNPVDMVYSSHSFRSIRLSETEIDFQKAWNLQDRRNKRLDLPNPNYPPKFWQYSEIGKFGQQIERLFNIFPREQVKIIVHEDFRFETQAVYEEVLSFLGLPSDGKTDFKITNQTPSYRFKFLGNLVNQMRRPWMVRGIMRAKESLGIERLGLMPRVRSWNKKYNSKPRPRPPLPPAFRAQLVEEFRGDLELLSRLIDRDLSHWSQ